MKIFLYWLVMDVFVENLWIWLIAFLVAIYAVIADEWRDE